MNTSRLIATRLKENFELAIQELNNSKYESKKYERELGFKIGIKMAIYCAFNISASFNDNEILEHLNKIILGEI